MRYPKFFGYLILSKCTEVTKMNIKKVEIFQTSEKALGDSLKNALY